MALTFLVRVLDTPVAKVLVGAMIESLGVGTRVVGDRGRRYGCIPGSSGSLQSIARAHRGREELRRRRTTFSF